MSATPCQLAWPRGRAWQRTCAWGRRHAEGPGTGDAFLDDQQVAGIDAEAELGGPEPSQQGRRVAKRLGVALDLSVAAATVLGRPGDGESGDTGAGRPGLPVAVVGRDPRASGGFLEAAVVAGLTSAGVDVLLLGVIPTPGVAYLTQALGAAFGVVISASHNPAGYNGIKFFGSGGAKLPNDVEDQIEARLRSAPRPRR